VAVTRELPEVIVERPAAPHAEVASEETAAKQAAIAAGMLAATVEASAGIAGMLAGTVAAWRGIAPEQGIALPGARSL